MHQVRDKLGCRGNFPEIYDKVNKKARSGGLNCPYKMLNIYFLSLQTSISRNTLNFFCLYVSFINFRQREDRLVALKDVQFLLSCTFLFSCSSISVMVKDVQFVLFCISPFEISFKTTPTFCFLVPFLVL